MNNENLIVPGSKEAIDKMRNELENEISMETKKCKKKYDIFDNKTIKSF